MTTILAICLLMTIRSELQPLAKTAFKIEETFSKLDSFQVQTSVNLTGSFNESGADRDKISKTNRIVAASSTSYREVVSDVSAKRVALAAVRQYTAASLRKKLDPAPETIKLRPTIRSTIVSRIDGQSSVTSPDGALTVAELDMLQSHIFTPALSGLLPSREVSVGDRWQARTESIVELTGIGPIQSGTVECRFTKLAGTNSLALIQFRGEIKGPSEHGLAHQRVSGQVTFDLASKCISALVLSAENTVFDESGKTSGTMSGRFEMRRSRSPAPEALRRLAQSPPPTTQAGSALVHNDATRRFSLIYPRNWELISSEKNIMIFQEPTGGTLRLVLDPTPRPSLSVLQKRITQWISDKKGRITSRPSALEGRNYNGFAVKGELPSTASRRLMEFVYLMVQSRGRVALFTTTLSQNRAATLRPDIQFMASRLSLTQ